MNENECGHMAGIWPAKLAFGAMRFWLFLVIFGPPSSDAFNLFPLVAANILLLPLSVWALR